MNITS